MSVVMRGKTVVAGVALMAASAGASAAIITTWNYNLEQCMDRCDVQRQRSPADIV